jgi:Ni,Fe-hydrogenase III component G
MPSATSDRKWSPDYRIAVPGKLLEPQEILAALQEAAGEAWLGGRTAGWTERAKPAPEAPAEGAEGAVAAAPAAQAPAPEFRQVWVDVKREGLRPAVEKLIAIHFPHFVVIAAEDRGEEIVLPYVFRLYHGKRHAEVLVTVSVHLPKAEPTVPSICDLVPGVLISEREKQEMMGVVVEGIPDGRRMFLPDDFPEGVYPWRKDETAPKAPMVRDLWSAGRPIGAG